MVIPKLRYQN